jgi:hypothetical protein
VIASHEIANGVLADTVEASTVRPNSVLASTVESGS